MLPVIVMATIQGAYHAVKNGHGQRSNHCPADALIKGRSNQTGAVVFDIMSSFGSHDEVFQEEWLRVYSVVLGGEAFMNVACAEAVKPILQNFAASMRNGNEFQYYVITP